MLQKIEFAINHQACGTHVLVAGQIYFFKAFGWVKVGQHGRFRIARFRLSLRIFVLTICSCKFLLLTDYPLEDFLQSEFIHFTFVNW